MKLGITYYGRGFLKSEKGKELPFLFESPTPTEEEETGKCALKRARSTLFVEKKTFDRAATTSLLKDILCP